VLKEYGLTLITHRLYWTRKVHQAAMPYDSFLRSRFVLAFNMSSFDDAFSKGSIEPKKSFMGLKHDLGVLVAQTWTKTKTKRHETSGQNRGISTTTVLLFTLAVSLFVVALGPDISCLFEVWFCLVQPPTNSLS